MNPETTLSDSQITAIFKHQGLSSKTISRITMGFTNEVYEVDSYILKVSVRPNHDDKFNTEVKLLNALQRKALVAKLSLA